MAVMFVQAGDVSINLCQVSMIRWGTGVAGHRQALVWFGGEDPITVNGEAACSLDNAVSALEGRTERELDGEFAVPCLYTTDDDALELEPVA